MTILTDHTIDIADCNGYGRCNAVPVWVSVPQDAGRVVLFPRIRMGQYFKAANIDKKEVVCPWCIGGGAKLWEWAANSYGAIFVRLLRKSTQTGGGAYRDQIPRSERMMTVNTPDNPEQAQKSLVDAIGMAVAAEGMPASLPLDTVVGRWAEDRIVLIGDYDESELWKELPKYRNISKEVVETWNRFIEMDDLQLEYRSDCSCRDNDDE